MMSQDMSQSQLSQGSERDFRSQDFSTQIRSQYAGQPLSFGLMVGPLSYSILQNQETDLYGRETYARLRAVAPEMSTVLMSGYNEQDASQHFVGKGLAGFVAKPFLVSELLDAIGKSLGVASV